MKTVHPPYTRRKFIKRCIMGCCALGWSVYSLNDFFRRENMGGLRVGFRNDAPAELWKWSREAKWYQTSGRMVHCQLCPHECILGENDRGFCRTRVVKNNKLHTVAYGNPCAVHLDPMEKKPMYHFLPGSPILSIATAGCNLRCLNCQNWEISQMRPEEVNNRDLMPDNLVRQVAESTIPAIAYTYSEPIIYYEYVRDTAVLARENGISNVLVSAGFILEKPLREFCRVLDAANIDLKGFSDGFYKKVTGARLEPVKQALRIMIEENVWVEVTRLIVPALSDNLDDIRAQCDWHAKTLGPGVPLHLSRFHPAYKLRQLPPTPIDVMNQAYKIARAAGLHFVYVGNVPGNPYKDTLCPKCGIKIIERRGYFITANRIKNNRCPDCNEIIPGVWEKKNPR